MKVIKHIDIYMIRMCMSDLRGCMYLIHHMELGMELMMVYRERDYDKQDKLMF